jgi:signal transduction histidine kinase/FixJ family two-component response regulator
MSDAPLVLNIDDHDESRYARSKVLQQAGFRVAEARSAADALRLIASELPTVALVDVQLPDMSGAELCRRILEHGADACLVEPVDPAVLLATVRALLRARRAEEAVRLADHEWRLTFEAITDGACFVDRAGVISRCNARFGHLIQSDGELTGRAIQSVLAPLLGEGVVDAGRPSTREIAIGARSLRVTVTPVPAAVMGTAGSVCILTDVTEHKRVEEMGTRLLAVEQRARAEAEAANRTKDEFLAVLSHELRTPLTSMLGWLRMLRTGRLDAAGIERAYDVLERSTRLQAQIVEDLLDVSRIISGKMMLALSPVSLPSVIEAAVESERSAAAAKQLTITTAVPAARLVADAGRLQQVFMNLVSNAVKFTDPGGRIEVRAAAEDRSVVVSVSDSGRGITPDILPFIFEPFRQAEGPHSRVHTGLGLGLAIVRHLVELHGGTVSVTSAGENRGSTFTVRLPADIESAPMAEPAEAVDVRAADLRGFRVLVVEDEGDTREILDVLLRESGAEVDAVPDAEAAMQAMRSRPPDVLISDIGMPEMDGYDLIRQIRRLAPDAGGRVPAIALTAFAHGTDHREALRAGYDRHLPKPVDAVTLTRTVRDVLYRRA